MQRASLLTALFVLASMVSACDGSAYSAGGTEFCLTGNLDLGARYQGLAPAPGEDYPMTWCVLTDDESGRVRFSATGNANPDMDDSWTVAYLPPDRVRIVNRDAPPDVEFSGVENFDGATRVRRLDPRRLLEDWQAGTVDDVAITAVDGHIRTVTSQADFPLRGRVEVEWRWNWDDPDRPVARLFVEDDRLVEARGRWRFVADDELEAAFVATGGAEPIDAPGSRWPARVDMRLIELAEDVWLVRGVRTGFQHLVVDTGDGLVVADAPAGWVEPHHVPAFDLVPRLGVSGLSEALIDFIQAELPGKPIQAVALTHHHDDHAGGARAFAAAGAEIYAPAMVASFLQAALNRDAMPDDRFSKLDRLLEVEGVDAPITIGIGPTRVNLLPVGSGPHAEAMLGVLVPERGYFFVSDIHVPRSEAPAPAAERAPTECWFAAWAVGSLPAETRVVNSHSPVVTPVTRLQEYLESDVCDPRP